MSATSVRTGSLVSSLICAGLGVLGAAAGAFSWMTSGHSYDLLMALSFVAITPLWYLRPLSFTAPIRQALKPRTEPVPRWVTALTVAGITLLWASIVLRWTT